MVYIDDPDHRDLNQIVPQLLAAGSEFFNRESKEPEVEFSKPLPEGHVDVGTPQVVEKSAREQK